MIEEMYREEFADSSEDSNPSFAGSSATREGGADQAGDWLKKMEHLTYRIMK